MNSQQEQDFSNLEALLALWVGTYQCVVVSYIGVKTAEGNRLLFGRILLEPCVGIRDAPFKVQTEHLIAARFVAGATPGRRCKRQASQSSTENEAD